MANKLRRSMHRRCLRYYYSFVFNNPPFSPFLRVTLLQTLNTSGKPYHSKILKTHIKVTQRVGEHGGESIKDNITEVPKAQRAIEP